MTSAIVAIATDRCRIAAEGGAAHWMYQAAGAPAHRIAWPVIEIEGQPVTLMPDELRRQGQARALRNGATEHRLAGPVAGWPGLTLTMVIRVAPGDPVCRFRYILESDRPRRLTKSAGRDNLAYMALSLAGEREVKEVAFSQFNFKVYSYMLREQPLEGRHFAAEAAFMGPMLVGAGEGHAMLVAYEHGSTAPDAYIAWHLRPERAATLRAVKGNYFSGQQLGPGQPFETVWLQIAAVAGGEDELAAAYRQFVLKHQTEALATRRPYIYYNTWADQCRLSTRTGKGTRPGLKLDRVLAEIDVAGRMGIDVFVLDAGWFRRCGDWPVDTELLPDGLAQVREALQQRGMKLGLWFSTQAALSAPIYEAHRDCAMSWRGKPIGSWSVWETEVGQHLCLVSRYVDAFAEELIRISRELGCVYFKWDAFGHYGCDEPNHFHGDAAASPEERGACYTFLFDRFMCRLADKLTEACPEAICDFDITEPWRNMGLGFLASGKYFLLNDGPYPGTYNIDPATTKGGFGIFAAPGPARAWNCREPLTYDKWLPSICFLTHYLPDDGADSQLINVASAILGQNGFWGDLLAVSGEGVDRIGRLIGLYKQVREDVTEASIRITGSPGDSPEVYEKIAPNGRGVVCVFSSISPCADARGAATYITQQPVSRQFVATDGVSVEFDAAGRAIIRCTFSAPSAGIVFFGAEETA